MDINLASKVLNQDDVFENSGIKKSLKKKFEKKIEKKK